MWQFIFLEIWYLNFAEIYIEAMMFLNIHWLGYVCRVEDGLIFEKIYPKAQYLVPLEQLGWSEASKWDISWHTLWFCSWMSLLFSFLGKELHDTDGWLVKFDKNIWNFTRTEGVFQREGDYCSGHVWRRNAAVHHLPSWLWQSLTYARIVSWCFERKMEDNYPGNSMSENIWFSFPQGLLLYFKF